MVSAACVRRWSQYNGRVLIQLILSLHGSNQYYDALYEATIYNNNAGGSGDYVGGHSAAPSDWSFDATRRRAER